MIKQAILLLNDRFASFDWLDRYGLLASPVTRTFMKKDGTSIKDTLPAATIASGVECHEKDMYFMVPDEGWKSMAYWELKTDYRISAYDDIPEGRGVEVTFDARLVLWWNVKALGYDLPEGLEDRMFFSLFTNFDGLRIDNPATLSAVRITYDMDRLVTDKKKIFGRYTYRDAHDWLFAPPNEYLAADFRITIITTRDCLPELHLGNADICSTRNSLTWDMALPDVATDTYQRWVSTGAPDDPVEFLITDFTLPDLSGLSAEQIDDLFLVFAGGRRLTFPDSYLVANGPDTLSIPLNYASADTPVELYLR